MRTRKEKKDAGDHMRGIVAFVAVLALLVSACGTGATEAEGRIVVAHWGGPAGEAREAVSLPGFTEDSGVAAVSLGGPIDYGKIKIMVDSGRAPDWDLATTALSAFFTLGPDYFEPVPYDENRDAWDGVINTHEYASPEHVNCEALLYRTDAYPEGGPTSWEDFWNVEDFPGVRALGADGGVPWFTLETALLGAGVPADELYPIDFEKALASLTTLRDTGDLLIWTSRAEATEMLATNQAQMVRTAVESAWDLVQSGEISVNWTNAICWTESIHILKGAANVDGAVAYLEYVVSPENQAAYAMAAHVGPVNPDAYEFIPEELHDLLPVPPEALDTVIWQDYQWYGDNYDNMVEEFDKWRLEA